MEKGLTKQSILDQSRGAMLSRDTSESRGAQNRNELKAYYHLPGLFEFYELYRRFLPLFREHREFFYDWCEIGSIYGAPMDCLWGGGRVENGDTDAKDVIALMREYGISARLTFSNSLLREEHLSDRKCNRLCKLFSADTYSGTEDKALGEASDGGDNIRPDVKTADSLNNGIIVHSELLLDYLKKKYPSFYYVSSTTKVLTDFDDLLAEVRRDDFLYVVPDFRLNKRFDDLMRMTPKEKNKLEFLCNECCYFGCKDRKVCYEDVSRKNLGEWEREIGATKTDTFHQYGHGEGHVCKAPNATYGYRFSDAMTNPGFIGTDDIVNTYMPMGFSNFKIEGRGLGSAIVLEFLLYYMTKPEYQLKVRERIYLDNTLDLF